jgi:hypothetical protein
MLIVLAEIDVDLILGASEKLNGLISVLVGLLPSIDKVKDIMVRQLKPLNLIWVLAMSLNDSIPCWLLCVKMEYELILKAKIRSKFHW